MRVISSCGNVGIGRAWPAVTRLTPCEASVTRPIAAQSTPAARQAAITRSASSGATESSSAPEAMVPSGSSPKASQSARPSGSTGMRSRSTRSPTSAAWASSQHAVATPPSVGSCIACTRAAPHAARASATTLMPGRRRKSRARLTTSPGTPRRSASTARSRATIAAPSSGTPLVSSSASPGCAPPVVTRRSFATSPSMQPETMARGSPAVTSVWPPIRVTSSSAHASPMSANSPSTASSVAPPSGSRTVARNQSGRAPRTATSLAFT